MDKLLVVMSLVLVIMAASTTGKTKKSRHSPMKKFLSGKRSGKYEGNNLCGNKLNLKRLGHDISGVKWFIFVNYGLNFNWQSVLTFSTFAHLCLFWVFCVPF